MICSLQIDVATTLEPGRSGLDLDIQDWTQIEQLLLNLNFNFCITTTTAVSSIYVPMRFSFCNKQTLLLDLLTPHRSDLGSITNMSKTAIKRLRTYPEMYPEIVYWAQHNEDGGNMLLSVLIDEMRLSKMAVLPGDQWDYCSFEFILCWRLSRLIKQ